MNAIKTTGKKEKEKTTGTSIDKFADTIYKSSNADFYTNFQIHEIILLLFKKHFEDDCFSIYHWSERSLNHYNGI